MPAKQSELREAATRGILHWLDRVEGRDHLSDGTVKEVQRTALELYPKGAVIQPREMRDPTTGIWYRIVDGRLQFRTTGGVSPGVVSWHEADPAATLADLYADPTETVDADDD